jgi:hypothetical protein
MWGKCGPDQNMPISTLRQSMMVISPQVHTEIIKQRDTCRAPLRGERWDFIMVREEPIFVFVHQRCLREKEFGDDAVGQREDAE